MPKNRGRKAIARRRSISLGVLAALGSLTPALTITQLGLWRRPAQGAGRADA